MSARKTGFNPNSLPKHTVLSNETISRFGVRMHDATHTRTVRDSSSLTDAQRYTYVSIDDTSEVRGLGDTNGDTTMEASVGYRVFVAFLWPR